MADSWIDESLGSFRQVLKVRQLFIPENEFGVSHLLWYVFLIPAVPLFLAVMFFIPHKQGLQKAQCLKARK